MKKKVFILLSTLVVTALSLAVILTTFLISKTNSNLYTLYNNRDHIFTLTRRQVLDSLNKIPPQCKKLSECKLLPGDILIRRYITERTKLIDRLIHPYFTHSAFYLGDDQIIEAVGREKIPENEIVISKLSESDWYNPDIEGFVVIRPKNISQKINIIQKDFKDIAENPNYVFGLPEPKTTQENTKNTRKMKGTCADLIFNQLQNNGLLTENKAPQIITPDYLFLTTLNNQVDFEIFGYKVL